MGIQAVGTGGSLNQQATATRTFYNRSLLQPNYHWLVLANFAEVIDIPLKEGQTVNLRRIEKLSAASTALTEGSPPSGSNLTINQVSGTVAQYGDFVEWTDKFVETGPDPYVTETLMRQGQQAMLTFDTVMQTALVAGTNVVYGGTATATDEVAAGDKPTTAKFDTIIQTLQENHVPPVTGFINPTTGVNTVVGEPAYIAVVTPALWKTIKALSGVDKVSTYQSGNNTLPGEVGKYDQLRFVMTTNGLVDAGAGASSIDVHQMLFFGAGAFAISRISGRELQSRIRPVGMPESGDELGQTGSVGWISYFVCFILNQDRIIRGEFAAA